MIIIVGRGGVPPKKADEVTKVRHSPVYRYLGISAASEFDFGSRYSMAVPK